MTKMTKIFIISLLFLASCAGKDYTAELEKIDSLKMVLDETELMLKEIKIDSLRSMHDVFKKNAADIKNHYYKDNQTNWEIITRYTAMKKPFRNVVEYYDNIKSELDYSHQQLDSLYHDLQYNLLPEELAHEYLTDEKNAIGELHSIVSKNLATSKVLIHDFDSLNKVTEEVLGKIKNKD